MINKITLILLSLLLTINLNAAEEYAAMPDPINPDIKKLQDWIGLANQEKDLQQMQGLQLDIKKNLKLLKNMQISLQSKVIPLFGTTIIQIDLHHVHTTKIYLPKGSQIIKFEATTDMKKISHLYNRADIRPLPDFVSCSIDLTFKYGNKLYDVTMIANKYDVSKENNKDNQFFPKVVLTLNKPLAPTDIIRIYRDSYKSLPIEPLTYFNHNNIVYKIEHSDFDTQVNPFNQPNLSVQYQNKLYKYKITVGTKE